MTTTLHSSCTTTCHGKATLIGHGTDASCGTSSKCQWRLTHISHCCPSPTCRGDVVLRTPLHRVTSFSTMRVMQPTRIPSRANRQRWEHLGSRTSRFPRRTIRISWPREGLQAKPHAIYGSARSGCWTTEDEKRPRTLVSAHRPRPRSRADDGSGTGTNMKSSNPIPFVSVTE